MKATRCTIAIFAVFCGCLYLAISDVEYAVNELFFCPNMSENVICSYDSSISVDDADIRVDNQTIHPFLPPPQSTGITDVIRSSLRVGNITIINTTLYFGADPNVSLAQCCYLGVCDMETYHLRLGSGCTLNSTTDSFSMESSTSIGSTLDPDIGGIVITVIVIFTVIGITLCFVAIPTLWTWLFAAPVAAIFACLKLRNCTQNNIPDQATVVNNDSNPLNIELATNRRSVRRQPLQSTVRESGGSECDNSDMPSPTTSTPNVHGEPDMESTEGHQLNESGVQPTDSDISQSRLELYQNVLCLPCCAKPTVANVLPNDKIPNEVQ